MQPYVNARLRLTLVLVLQAVVHCLDLAKAVASLCTETTGEPPTISPILKQLKGGSTCIMRIRAAGASAVYLTDEDGEIVGFAQLSQPLTPSTFYDFDIQRSCPAYTTGVVHTRACFTLRSPPLPSWSSRVADYLASDPEIAAGSVPTPQQIAASRPSLSVTDFARRRATLHLDQISSIARATAPPFVFVRSSFCTNLSRGRKLTLNSRLKLRSPTELSAWWRAFPLVVNCSARRRGLRLSTWRRSRRPIPIASTALLSAF